MAARASADAGSRDASTAQLYRVARVVRTAKPIIAAVHGPAIGGGLGLALVADFRVTCAEATFSANFTKLGFHPGFGLTVTLPELIGKNAAALLFLTSGASRARRLIASVWRMSWRLKARWVAPRIRSPAYCSLRAGVAAHQQCAKAWPIKIAAATEWELAQQSRLRSTQDFQEGIRASIERREPRFEGR